MSSKFTVAAIRFTDDVDSMRSFLELLGLSPRVTAGGWADMRAGNGAVWVHDRESAAEPQPNGATCLSGEVTDLDALADRLRDAGLTPMVLDEAFGRSVTVIDPMGAEVLIQERQTDFYGYNKHAPQPDERLVVAPVRFTEPSGPYVPFLMALGLRQEGHADEWYASYVGDGQIGLHHDDGTNDALQTGNGATVHLTFITSEDLEHLASRLEAAGHPATITRDEFVSFVEVTDPDGHPVQIHAAG